MSIISNTSDSSVTDAESQKNQEAIPETVPLWSLSSTRLYIGLAVLKHFEILDSLSFYLNVCGVMCFKYAIKYWYSDGLHG